MTRIREPTCTFVDAHIANVARKLIISAVEKCIFTEAYACWVPKSDTWVERSVDGVRRERKINQEQALLSSVRAD